MDENHYTVYCHTNKKNGKKYFGITGTSVEDRWANGRGYNHQPFGKAVKKYGWDGFYHEIIKEGLSEEEACEMERTLIERFRTTDKANGYNVCEGGSTGTTGVRYGEEVRENMRKATYLTYEKDPEMKHRISESVKSLYENPEYAELMRQRRREAWQRPEYREHQIAVRKGKKHAPMSEEARQKISVKKKGKKRSKEVCEKISESHKKSPVLQYTMDMVFVAEYPSMSVAGKQTGVRNGCISLCCKSKRKSAGGFIWKLKAVDSSG